MSAGVDYLDNQLVRTEHMFWWLPEWTRTTNTAVNSRVLYH